MYIRIRNRMRKVSQKILVCMLEETYICVCKKRPIYIYVRVLCVCQKRRMQTLMRILLQNALNSFAENTLSEENILFIYM